MNEVKTIHLGRDTFTIAIDAYKALQDYLHAIEKQVGKESDVLQEVELRMAELLRERGITEDKVVLPADVMFLKEQLGQPHDFKDDGEESTASSKKTTSDHEGPRRLYRDTENGMIAGVASGMAAYFNVDSLIIRLLFVVLAISGGTGILLYILLWILVPEATTSSEKLQMQGKAVTVDSLKRTVSRTVERADLPGAGHRAGKAVRRVFGFVGNVLRYALGAVLTTIALALFVFTIVTGTYTLVHGVTMGNEVFFPVGAQSVWGVVCAMIALGLLAILLLLVGITMFTRKWALPGWVMAAMVGVFFIAASVGTAIGFDVAPQFRDRYRELQKTQMITAQPFTSAVLKGKETMFRFEPDNNYRLEVKYFGKVQQLEGFNQKVENGQLTVDTTEYQDQQRDCFFCVDPGGLEVIIHAPALAEVQVDGDEDTVFKASEPFEQSTMKLMTSTRVTAIIEDVAIGKVVLDASESQGHQGRMLFTLADLKPAAVNADALHSYTGGSVYLYRVGELDLTTGERVCAESDPFVSSDQGSKSMPVVLNGQTVNSVDQLAGLQTESPGVYNCLTIY